jgi:PAS domain S-box-containing protein
MEQTEAKKGWPGSEDLLQGVFNAAAIGIAVEDLEGRPLFANPALCTMLGFTEEELCSKHCVEFSPPEDAKKDWILFEQLRQRSISNYHLDKRFFRKDGTLLWGRLSISLMKDPVSSTQLVVAMVEDISEEKAAEGKLQYLASRLIQVREEERQRIGRELHDDIGQRLSLLIVEMEDLHQSFAQAGQKSYDQLVSGLHRRAEALATDIQSLSRDLHSSKLEVLGLHFALRNLCEKISTQRHIAITLQAEELPEDSPSDLELCIFRVAQEALNNVVKHSRSTQASVELTHTDGVIILNVRDSGVGIDPSVPHSGIGLSTMRERLRMFGGELYVESIPGKGTMVIAQVKLEKTQKATTG